MSTNMIYLPGVGIRDGRGGVAGNGCFIFVKMGRSYALPSRAPTTCQFDGTGRLPQD
ncbi:hypothetical protein [Spirosoma luteum]|uniref:hypothetical protein n=1 Tax=Spirosoma luteum TaxID=431553 RepID=UPI0003A3380A|nr:hypothetical protein [Spirosoma luteum]